MTSSSTSPLPNPDGDAVYSPKVLGQSSRVRQEISQYSTIRVGVQTIIGGDHMDPDTVKATLYKRVDFNPGSDPLGPNTVYTGTDLNHEDVGVYSFVLDPTTTSDMCQLTIAWEYSVSGVTYQYWDYYQILGYMPTYETLNEGERGIVRLVAMMFEDLYDSVEGGPHLKEEFQTHFGSETIARCMEMAMDRINITSQPYTNYNVGAGTGPRFPADKYSLLRVGTYLEVIRHLMRSYVEQPTMQGSPGVASLERRDYLDRWSEILESEAEDYKNAVRGFKRKLLGLGGGSLLVAGGIYSQVMGWRSGSYSAAARAGRFTYPASVVMVRPGGS